MLQVGDLGEKAHLFSGIWGEAPFIFRDLRSKVRFIPVKCSRGCKWLRTQSPRSPVPDLEVDLQLQLWFVVSVCSCCYTFQIITGVLTSQFLSHSNSVAMRIKTQGTKLYLHVYLSIFRYPSQPFSDHHLRCGVGQ